MLGMTTHAEIIKCLGASRIAEAIGVAENAVSMAKGRKKFPPSWYDVLDAMCAERGIDCPRELFNFKSPVIAPEASCLSAERGDVNHLEQPLPSKSPAKAAS